jgi:hypothetical protein
MNLNGGSILLNGYTEGLNHFKRRLWIGCLCIIPDGRCAVGQCSEHGRTVGNGFVGRYLNDTVQTTRNRNGFTHGNCKK